MAKQPVDEGAVSPVSSPWEEGSLFSGHRQNPRDFEPEMPRDSLQASAPPSISQVPSREGGDLPLPAAQQEQEWTPASEPRHLLSH